MKNQVKWIPHCYQSSNRFYINKSNFSSFLKCWFIWSVELMRVFLLLLWQLFHEVGENWVYDKPLIKRLPKSSRPKSKWFPDDEAVAWCFLPFFSICQSLANHVRKISLMVIASFQIEAPEDDDQTLWKIILLVYLLKLIIELHRFCCCSIADAA